MYFVQVSVGIDFAQAFSGEPSADVHRQSHMHC